MVIKSASFLSRFRHGKTRNSRVTQLRNDNVKEPLSTGPQFPHYEFLDASTHLYKRVCPSVRPYVRPYVRPSECPSVCP